MSGYREAMKDVVDETKNVYLEHACGCYFCDAELCGTEGKVIVEVSNPVMENRTVMGSTEQYAKMDVAVYQLFDDLLTMGENCWKCIGSVPGALTLSPEEIACANTVSKVVDKVKRCLIIGLKNSVGLTIRSMDKMDGCEVAEFRDKIIRPEYDDGCDCYDEDIDDFDF